MSPAAGSGADRGRPRKRAASRAPRKSSVAARQADAGYSGTPLPKKLGIKPGTVVALVAAPPAFDLPDLPEGARVRRGARGRPDLVLWFVDSKPQLELEIRRIAAFCYGSPLWIAWRKKTSGASGSSRSTSAPSENDVREAGLAAGLVDTKVCAIDAEWSGLRFTPRRTAG